MGRGLGKIGCTGKLGGVSRRKKPMRIIKCCMINEHFLESLSVCLELTLQQVSWLFCRMKTDSIVLSCSLQAPANILFPPFLRAYCLSWILWLISILFSLSFCLFLNFDTVEFSLIFFILLSFLRNGMNYLLRNSDTYFHEGTSVIRSGHMT